MDAIPEILDEGVLYVSVPYATVIHTCLCGCGHEVVTPLSPRQWSLIYNGVTVSLRPSVGNWSFPCQSHYWITENEVLRARRFTPGEIADLRADDRNMLDSHYGPTVKNHAENRRSKPWWVNVSAWVRNRFTRL